MTKPGSISRRTLAGAALLGSGGVATAAACLRTANVESVARRLFAAVDALDPDRVIAFMTDDVRLTFANAEPLVGKDAVKASFAAARDLLASVRHDATGFWRGEDGEFAVVAVEARVAYRLRDGREVVLPATSALRLKGSLVADYRIFMDPRPVFG
jgi:ketosteroid isomerase-like protein